MLLGDPGANNCELDDKIVVEMVRFPTHCHPGEGVITEVLRGCSGVDMLSIIREYNLPEAFADYARWNLVRGDGFDECVPEPRPI